MYTFKDSDGIIRTVPAMRGGMQVTIKFPNGKSLPFNCDLDDRFEVLKRKISERYTQIPYDQLVVLFQEKPLQEAKTLKDFEIRAESVLEALSVSDLISRFQRKMQSMGDSQHTPTDQMYSSGLQQSQLHIQLKEKDQLILSLQQQINSKGDDKSDALLVDRLQKKIKSLQTQCDEEQSNGQKLLEQLFRTKQEATEMKNTMGQMEQMQQFESQSYLQQLDMKNKSVESLHDEVRSLKRKLLDTNQEMEKLKENYQEKVYEDRIKDSDIRNLQEQVNNLKQQLSGEKRGSMTASTEAPREDVTARMTIQSQQKKLEVQNMELEEQRKKLQDMKKKIEGQQQNMVEKDQDISNQQQQYKEALLKIGQKDAEIDRLNQIIQNKCREIESVSARLQNETKQGQNLQGQLESQINKLKQECFNQKVKIDELEQQSSQLQRNTQQLQGKLQEEVQDKENLQQQKDEELIKLRKETKRLNEQIMQIQSLLDQTEMEKRSTEQNLNMEKQKFSRLSQDYDALSKSWNEMETKYSAQVKSLQGKKEALARLLQQKKSQKSFRDGIIGPTEALFNSNPNFTRFMDDQNAVTDTAEFSMSLIKIVEEEFEKKLSQVSDLNLTSAYQMTPITTIQALRTVNAVADGDRQQIFLFEVKEDPNNFFTGQIFAIKHFKDSPKFTDPKQACESVIGNLVAKFLLYKYLVKLKQHMKEKISEFKYQDLFLLEHVQEDSSKVYYICEKILPGNFTKYNGAGKFRTGQYQEICNSFTFFSYIYTQRQLIVSNVQAIDTVLCDPTVSTEDGILDDNDLGYDELSTTVSKFKDLEPTVIGKKYLSALAIKSM